MDALILQWFESIRNPFLDGFFAFFSFFGEGLALTVAVILLYWLLGRTGEQLAVTTLTTLPLNSFLKGVIARPRPYVDGVVSRVEIDNFFLSTVDLNPYASMPSGHAQSSSAFLSGVALRSKRGWIGVSTLLFAFLIMCSRVYFGVHYPTDVLVGFILGLTVAILWELAYRYLYSYRHLVLLGCALLAAIPLFFGLTEEHVQATGLLAGGAIGLFASSLFAREPMGKKRFWRILVGGVVTGGAFALKLLLPEGEFAYQLLFYFLLALVATVGAQGLFRLFRV